MERYFDAFVYVANWGTHRLMRRFPRGLLDRARVLPYATEECLRAWTTAGHVVVGFHSEAEYGEDDDDGQGWMASLLPVRAELAVATCARCTSAGSRASRPWLAGVQAEEVDEAALEPPVPPGLGTPSAALRALVAFLRLDADLLEIAASTSAALAPRPSRRALVRWLDALPGLTRPSCWYAW